MRTPIQALLVEDDPTDAELLRDGAGPSEESGVAFTWARSLAEAEAAIARARPDVALLDLGLGDAEGLEGLERLREAHPGLPIVILTGRLDTALAVKAMKAGAQDYLVKGTVTGALVVKSALYAIERKEREETMSRLAAIVEGSEDAFVSVDRAGRVVAWNPAAERLFAVSARDAMGRPISEFVAGARARESIPWVEGAARGERSEWRGATWVRSDGGRFAALLSASPLHGEGSTITGALLVIRDLARLRQMEREVGTARRALEARVRELV